MNSYCNSYIPFGMYLSVENNMFPAACIPLGMHPDRMQSMVHQTPNPNRVLNPVRVPVIYYQEMHP